MVYARSCLGVRRLGARPFRLDVEYTFARDEYEATILRELEYQGRHPSPE